MHVIKARNVHAALPLGLDLLNSLGDKSTSRNGEVIVLADPVTTVYERPRERVMFHPERDANPFFHLLESLWMMGGRNDVGYVANIVDSMRNFSDDGKTFHAAYGYRWRHHFGIDQIDWAIKRLRNDWNDRRVVIDIWDGTVDPAKGDAGGKDLPCNLVVKFKINLSGSLDMVVHNRSNDVVWGAYGANAVHFSFLQEYIATAVGVPVGRYWQVSDDMHGYPKTFGKVESLGKRSLETHSLAGQGLDNPYIAGEVEPYPIISTDTKTWEEDLEIFLAKGAAVGFRDRFFRRVAVPMLSAHSAYRRRDDELRYAKAREILEQCIASDWRRAGIEWINRREQASREKEKSDGAS